MLRFVKYIVIFFFGFNIMASHAAEVIFEPFENDSEIEEVPIPSFTGAASLPHPVQLREMIDHPGNSALGKLFILAQYFEARYPNDALDLDFSEDVALIFPDMDEKQVQTTTKYIKMAIRIYRLGKEKIADFEKEKLAPKDPPLIVSDDQYAIIGDRDYIETKEGEVAVISDFKKVIGYGSNPREIEAMDAFVQRKIESKKNKTDFENFRLMLSKLDWSKITSYGVTMPSPFVGNAGIGAWVENDGFKARIVSDTARINDKASLLLGLHMDVPSHRFMLASTLSESLQRPQIEVVASQNINSYEIFYPMPVLATTDKLISTYRGDFAFPIKISLKEPKRPFEITLKITFQNCDAEMDCKPVTLEPTLSLEVEHTDTPVVSSMSNFVHQSLYNIPSSRNKYISLENVSYTLDEKQEVSKINFDFKYDAPIQNFALFLENEENTVFLQPTFVTNQNHIYAQVSPLENAQNILNLPLTLTVRLNNYATLKKTIMLQNFKNTDSLLSFKSLLWLGFLFGLLFYITPFGLALALPSFFIEGHKNKLFYTLSKASCLTAFLAYLSCLAYQDRTLFYVDASTNILYISLALMLICALLTSIPFTFLKNTHHPAMQGLIYACLIVFMLPLSHTPYAQNFLSTLYSSSSVLTWGASIIGLLLGLILPDLCALYFTTKQKTHTYIKNFAFLLSKALLVLAFVTTVLWIFFAVTFFSFCKITLLFIVAFLFLKYLLHFWEALYKTDLKASYVSGTEKALLGFVSLFILLFGFSANSLASIPLKQTEHITFDQIDQRIMNGENLIVSFQSPNCLVCKYNNLTVFLPYQIENLKKQYNISYVSIKSLEPTQNAIEFLQKYKKFQRPLYVFYNPLVPDGAALPNLITPQILTRTFENFDLYPSSPSVEELEEKRRKTPRR